LNLVLLLSDPVLFQDAIIFFLSLFHPLVNIDDYAFYQVYNLRSVNISAGTVSIGKYAFSETGVTSFVFPPTITSIGENCLNDCSKLESVFIPGSIKEIPESAFYDCPYLTNITISNGVTKIDGYAFGQCTRLKHVSFPSSVTTIAAYAFAGCKLLDSVTYRGTSDPGSVFSFDNCPSLDSVCLPAEYTSNSFCGLKSVCKGDIESCETGFKQENHCYEFVCANGKGTLKRRLNATQYEQKATRCNIYECHNDTGPFHLTLCLYSSSDAFSFSLQSVYWMVSLVFLLIIILV